MYFLLVFFTQWYLQHISSTLKVSPAQGIGKDVIVVCVRFQTIKLVDLLDYHASWSMIGYLSIHLAVLKLFIFLYSLQHT